MGWINELLHQLRVMRARMQYRPERHYMRGGRA